MLLTKKILGTPRKRIGDVVFSDWNGLTTARTYNPSPANPQTESQTNNRNKFTLMNLIAKKVADLTAIGLRRALPNMTHRNAFVKLNAHNGLFALNSGNWGLSDYQAMVLSQGSLSNPQDLTVNYSSVSGVVQIDFDAVNKNGNDRQDDRVCVMCVTQLDEASAVAVRAANRVDGTVSLTYPVAISAGTTLRVWLFFNSNNGTNCSPTSYAEITV